MKELAEKLTQNPYFIFLGWLATVIALIMSIAVPIIQARRVRLSFTYLSIPLVIENQSQIDGLDIKYRGNAIDQLSVTTCEICNTGNVTIEDSDVYDGHKLRIQAEPGYEGVLFADVVSQSYDTNNCQVAYDNNGVTVRFDTLEINDKVVICIYHSGDWNTVFSLKGKIKEGVIDTPDQSPIRRILIGILSFSVLLFIATKILDIIFSRIASTAKVNLLFLIIAYLFFFIIIIAVSIMVLKKSIVY